MIYDIRFGYNDAALNESGDIASCENAGYPTYPLRVQTGTVQTTTGNKSQVLTSISQRI